MRILNLSNKETVIAQAREFFNRETIFYNGWIDFVYHLDAEKILSDEKINIENLELYCIPSDKGFVVEVSNSGTIAEYAFSEIEKKEMKKMYKYRKRSLKKGLTLFW